MRLCRRVLTIDSQRRSILLSAAFGSGDFGLFQSVVKVLLGDEDTKVKLGLSFASRSRQQCGHLLRVSCYARGDHYIFTLMKSRAMTGCRSGVLPMRMSRMADSSYDFDQCFSRRPQSLWPQRSTNLKS